MASISVIWRQADKNDTTERARGLGRKTREKIGKGNQMKGPRFQTRENTSDIPDLSSGCREKGHPCTPTDSNSNFCSTENGSGIITRSYYLHSLSTSGHTTCTVCQHQVILPAQSVNIRSYYLHSLSTSGHTTCTVCQH